MSRIRDFESRLNLQKTFSATGVVGDELGYKRRGETWLRLVTEGVGSTNSIQVQGRLFGQTSWQSVGSPIVGLGSGATIDVKDYDELRFNCTIYDGADDVAEVQKIAFSAVPDGGAWTIKYGLLVTGSLAFGANAATIQTALRLLAGLSAVVVAGNYTTGFTITWPEIGNIATQLEVPTHTLVIGATPVVATVTTETEGSLGTDDAKLIASGFYL